jgi:hypothetical protein
VFRITGELNPFIKPFYIKILIFFCLAVSETSNSLTQAILLTSYINIIPFSVATAKNLPSGEYFTVVGRFFSLSNYY